MHCTMMNSHNVGTGSAVTCNSWPATKGYYCTDVGATNWTVLDRNMDTSQTASCESLCLQQGAYGCCYLKDGSGCYWKVGGSSIPGNTSAISVTCSISGMFPQIHRNVITFDLYLSATICIRALLFRMFTFPFCILIVDNSCNEVHCAIMGEVCVGGVCKCGCAASCEGQISGAYCDAANSVCKCSATLSSCTGGETCDVASNVCKCGDGSSCAGHIIGQYCDVTNNVCKCSPSIAACTSPEICDSTHGVCKCGSSHSCSGRTTGDYCDYINSQCKCSSSVAECKNGTTCMNGKCSKSPRITLLRKGR